ncbi:MAG: hypothetical protein ABIH09_02170 [Candidatus Omnitrophota bacterium]
MKKNINVFLKYFVCFLTIVFINLCFLLPAIYAQVKTSSSVAVNNVIDNTTPAAELKQPLPKPGNITVNFKDVDIQTVLHYLSEVSGVDIIPSPGVEGTVTMRLRDKPWEVALDIVTRNYSYAYSRDDEKGIIRVMPKSSLQAEEPITEVIALNYIIESTEGSTGAAVVSDEETDNSESSDKNISQLMKAINSVIFTQSGEKATFLPTANAIVVTAIPARVSIIKDMLIKLDKKTPQIMLEAKVIEVTLDRNDQFGVDWNAVISAAGANRPTTFPFRNDGSLSFLPSKQTNYYPASSLDGAALTGVGNFPIVDVFSAVGQRVNPTTFTTATNSANLFSFGTLDFSQFSARLRLIDERDDTKILSSPRITTLNNQPAVIKVISNVFLQKQQTSTDTASVVTVEFETEPREIGVILEVTPHVNENGEIMVNLRPQVSSSLDFSELQVSGSANTVAMTYNSREADTQVMVTDGETIFIGGLITETKAKEDHKFPILGDIFGDIPIVGGIFKYKQDNVDKTEVVFFITVNILDDDKESIERSEMHAKLYREYYLNHKDNQTEQKSKSKTEINKGKLKTSHAAVEVDKTNISGVEQKRGSKPFFDFRKTKTKE